MQRNVSYTCSVGLCNGEGVCDRTGLWIGCWTNTPPPNSTNVTTKPPTTTTASPGTGHALLSNNLALFILAKRWSDVTFPGRLVQKCSYILVSRLFKKLHRDSLATKKTKGVKDNPTPVNAMTPVTPFGIVIFLCTSQALVGFSATEGKKVDIHFGLTYRNKSKICLLNTAIFPLSVGCVMACKNSTQHLPNGTECLSLSEAAATAMQSNVNYTCPVGICFNGECQHNGLAIGCWHDTPPPNSTNVTTKAPTTTATSAGPM
ncbi:hypothetical protein V5799_021977 [Amblyomma americanum]|uniref:Evasin n=1 Tax=Amblyomma americanum TaxID=6943 RepID=A0AAQ4FLV5_AMBAM